MRKHFSSFIWKGHRNRVWKFLHQLKLPIQFRIQFPAFASRFAISARDAYQLGLEDRIVFDKKYLSNQRLELNHEIAIQLGVMAYDANS